MASAVGIGPCHERLLQLLDSPLYNGDDATLLRAHARRRGARTRAHSGSGATCPRSSEHAMAKVEQKTRTDDSDCSTLSTPSAHNDQQGAGAGPGAGAAASPDPEDPFEMSECELREALGVLKRFFLSLLLLDLINELRLSDAVEKYALGKAQIQQFQQQSSNFAGNYSIKH